ncbi:VLN1 [Symbiodinium sp. CCMP2456]|nr:VLN1 [Symbiodinium sp. CCMP2456]
MADTMPDDAPADSQVSAAASSMEPDPVEAPVPEPASEAAPTEAEVPAAEPSVEAEPTEAAPVEAEVPAPEPSSEAAPTEAEVPAAEPSVEEEPTEAAPVEPEVPAPEPSSEAAEVSAPVAPIEPAEAGVAQTVSSTSSATVKKMEDGKWKVDTGYIDHRTKDPNRLESRRSVLDESVTTAASVARSERDEEGKFKVDMSYINHRTKEVGRLEGRRSVREPEALAGTSASASVRKDGGTWKVDTSYIGHRTGDTGNFTRKEAAEPEAAYADPAQKKYSHEELRVSSGRPEDVDPAKRELYLSEDDFQAVFGMAMADFLKQPKWKQQNAKKSKATGLARRFSLAERSKDAERVDAYDSGRRAKKTLESQSSVELSLEDFEAQVLRSNEVWFVQAYDPNDGTCKSFATGWEDVAHSYGDHARFGRLDITKKELKAASVETLCTCKSKSTTHLTISRQTKCQ